MFTAAGFAKTLAYWKLFLQGVVCTVCLSFLTVLFGFLLALLITGMRMSDFRPFRALALTRDGHERSAQRRWSCGSCSCTTACSTA